MSDSFNISSLVNNGQGLPTAGSNNGGLGDIAENFTTFLTLLTTQLQNQDPLDPTDTNEFTNQLVSFSQVEQQIRSNESLDNIARLLRSNTLASQANFLGQSALVSDDTGTHEGQGITWQYILDDTPENTTLRVLDEDNRPVFETPGGITEGLHNFEWNGLTSSGELAPHGIYQLEVVAVNQSDEEIGAALFVEDRITSLDPATGQFFVGDNAFEQFELLRLVAPKSSLIQQQPGIQQQPVPQDQP